MLGQKEADFRSKTKLTEIKYHRHAVQGRARGGGVVRRGKRKARDSNFAP